LGFGGGDDKIVRATVETDHRQAFSSFLVPAHFKENRHDNFKKLMNARISQHRMPHDSDGYTNTDAGTVVVCALRGRLPSL
jgi:hypothetical protein